MTKTNKSITLVVAAIMTGALGCGGSGSSGSTGTAGRGGAGGGGGGASGAAGTSGTAGNAGSAGAAGSGGAGGAVGTGGRGATGNAGADGGVVSCLPGGTCTADETCSGPCVNGTRDIACFCDSNGHFSCETCTPFDAGAGGSGGLDGGLVACPANPMGMACTSAGSFCAGTCMNGMAETCRCQSSAAGPDGGTTMRWRCQSLRCL